MKVTPPRILSTRSSYHNRQDHTQQLRKLYASREESPTGVTGNNITNNYMPPVLRNKMNDKSSSISDDSDGLIREITPIKNDGAEEGASEIDMSPGNNNDASPDFNKQDQGSPNPDWPLTNIDEPGPNDCLFGRGGGTNHHAGNKKYRKKVEEKKDKYLSSKRLDKPLVAMEIINEWRSMDPPGRFLKQDEKTKLWHDVGDRKAREKTSQALREKAPSEHGASTRGEQKETRFEPGTLSPRGGRSKPSLAREHSLGTDPMGAHEMSLEGFSWDETDQPVVDNRGANLRNYRHPYSPYDQQHVRQHSLATNPLPEASTANPAPPFGDPYYHHYHPHYSSPPPPHHHYPHHPPPPPHYHSPQGHPQYHPSASRHREHSLQMNPLKGASTTQPARDTFTDPNYEGQSPPPYPPPPPSYYYPPGPPPPPHHWGPPPPPPQYYPGSHPSAFSQYDGMRPPAHSPDFDDRPRSSSSRDEDEDGESTFQDFTKLASLIRESTEGSTLERSSSADESGRGSTEHSIQKSYSLPLESERGAFPSPPKNTTSRKEIGGESPARADVRKPSLLKKISGGSLRNKEPVPAPDGAIRPEPVKRDTSNQPETLETKRSTKRVILSRDKSAIAKSLKEAQRQKDESARLSPKMGISKADLDRNLSVEMHKLGLSNDVPQNLDRMTTNDVLGEIFDDENLSSPLSQPGDLAQNDLANLDAVYNGSRLQSVEWDDTLNLLVEESNESDIDPSAVAVNEEIAARWISGTSAHDGTEI